MALHLLALLKAGWETIERCHLHAGVSCAMCEQLMPEGLPGWALDASLERGAGNAGWRAGGDKRLCLQVFLALFYI